MRTKKRNLLEDMNLNPGCFEISLQTEIHNKLECTIMTLSKNFIIDYKSKCT